LSGVQKGLFITSQKEPESDDIQIGLTYEGPDLTKNQLKDKTIC